MIDCCHYCTERNPYCHSYCTKYIEAKRVSDEENAKIRKIKEFEASFYKSR